MHHTRQRTRAPVTILPRYEAVAKERRRGWVVAWMVLFCKHGLHRTTLHRLCNKLGRKDPYSRAHALGSPRLPRRLPRNRTSVTVLIVSLDREEVVSVLFAKGSMM